MRGVMLSGFTTFGVGGVSSVRVAKKPEDLLTIHNEIILGGGSNVLIGEKNLPAFVINRVTGMNFYGDGVYAYSGERMSKLCLMAGHLSYGGLEWAYGLPGSVGGAVVGNAGCMGRDVCSCVRYADVIRDGKSLRLYADQCGFSYRASAFLPSDVITGAFFTLFKDRGEAIAERLAQAVKHRKSQPGGRSAGCIFKNTDRGSAGMIIDQCGLKGARVGGAYVSYEHANFIISDGSATPSDIYGLIRRIECEVFEKTGITLRREIKIYGDF